jgi:7,8-dihydro-6-hydroxymethylpterin-pyrophosphokinase
MFVLKPLADIAHGLVHPVLKKSIRTIAENCPDKSIVKKVDNSQLFGHSN